MRISCDEPFASEGVACESIEGPGAPWQTFITDPNGRVSTAPPRTKVWTRQQNASPNPRKRKRGPRTQQPRAVVCRLHSVAINRFVAGTGGCPNLVRNQVTERVAFLTASARCTGYSALVKMFCAERPVMSARSRHRRRSSMLVNRRHLVLGGAAIAAGPLAPRLGLVQDVSEPFKLDPLPYPLSPCKANSTKRECAYSAQAGCS